jgi:hypothetical protein
MRHIMFENIDCLGQLQQQQQTHEFPLYDTSIYVAPCHLVIPPQKSVMVHFSGGHVMHTLEENREPMILGQDEEDLCMWVINTSHLQPVVVPKGKPLDRVIDDSFWVLAYFSVVPRSQRLRLIKNMLMTTSPNNVVVPGVETLVTMMNKGLAL